MFIISFRLRRQHMLMLVVFRKRVQQIALIVTLTFGEILVNSPIGDKNSENKVKRCMQV